MTTMLIDMILALGAGMLGGALGVLVVMLFPEPKEKDREEEV